MPKQQKQYSNVTDMMRDVADSKDFVTQLADHLGRRHLVTELIAMRAAKGFTQQQLAEKLGFSQSRISKLETSTNDSLDLATVVAYADALGFGTEMTFVPKDTTIVDRVRHHAFCIKSLTDKLARLGSKDKKSADGVGSFLKEAAFNLVRLVQSSSKLLSTTLVDNCTPLAISVYATGGDDDQCEAEGSTDTMRRFSHDTMMA